MLLRYDRLIVIVEPGNAIMMFRMLVWPGGGGLANGLASSESLPVVFFFFNFNWLLPWWHTDVVTGDEVLTDRNLSIILCPEGGGKSNGFGCKYNDEEPVFPWCPFLPSFLLADRLCTTMMKSNKTRFDSKHRLIWVQRSCCYSNKYYNPQHTKTMVQKKTVNANFRLSPVNHT